MTDQELIKVLRCCQKTVNCLSCEARKDCSGIDGVLGQAGDRLEALVAENELLYREVAKLKAECDHFRDLTKKMWCEKQYGEDADVPTSTEGVARCGGRLC